MVMGTIKPIFENVFYDDNEFQSCFYVWEHLASLLCRYYKCSPHSNDWNPVGGFVRKRVSMLRMEDDFYTNFFKKAEIDKDNWEPLRQGLFDGKYSEFERTYEESEAFYRAHNRY